MDGTPLIVYKDVVVDNDIIDERGARCKDVASDCYRRHADLVAREDVIGVKIIDFFIGRDMHKGYISRFTLKDDIVFPFERVHVEDREDKTARSKAV